MSSAKLKDYLEDQHAHYVRLPHALAYTAQEIAENVHVSGRQYAKAVVVKIEGKLAMVVMPASGHLNFEALREELGTDDIVMVDESEFAKMMPDCERGAIPPFGKLYNMDVYLSQGLVNSKNIVFNSGDYLEAIQLPSGEFRQLLHPDIVIHQ